MFKEGDLLDTIYNGLMSVDDREFDRVVAHFGFDQRSSSGAPRKAKAMALIIKVNDQGRIFDLLDAIDITQVADPA